MTRYENTNAPNQFGNNRTLYTMTMLELNGARRGWMKSVII